MVEKKQQMRFSDAELEVIKNTFRDNDELLKALRKFMLQLPMTKSDKSLIKSLQDKPEAMAIIRKAFLPTLDGDAPFHQLVDLWMTVELKDKSPREVFPVLLARKLLIAFLDQQLEILEGKDRKEIINLESHTEFVDDYETLYSNLLFRNTMIGHTEMQMNQFVVLAGQSDETVEQMEKRLQQNSTK